MAWVFLFIASVLEIGWTFCLKYMNFKNIVAIKWAHFFSDSQYFFTLLPLIGYIILGIGNVVFFSMATKQIPLATAMGVWIGTALVGVNLVDMFVFKQPYTWGQLFFFALIIIGAIGLKASTATTGK